MTLLNERVYLPQDLLDDPTLDHYELVGGQLRERAMSERSCAVALEIARLLANEASKNRQAIVYGSDMGYRCFPNAPRDVRFPDASVIRASRRALMGDDPAFIPIPADLAVEVLSPKDVLKEVEEKVDAYLDAGFALVWVVNPRRRHVHVYRSGGGVQLLAEQDEISGEAALPEFRCKVGEFFNT